MNDRMENYLPGHGLALKTVYEDKIIDKALEDYVAVGGGFRTAEAVTGLSASSISTPTAGYPAPEQAFSLLSNLGSDKNPTSTYHTVTIEGFTEGNPHAGMFFPIEVNGVKKWVSGVTVKEAPTAVKGVINTFLPKKLKHFNYSENFGAWKPVGAVDEWGNFTIKDLKLAEGQNVIAFDAESWVGNKSNQQLKIILNTIPCLPGNCRPAAGAFINNPRPKISVEFNKSKYVGTTRGFTILACELDGAHVPYTTSVTSETYTEKVKIELQPENALSDGEHNVVIKIDSEVGVSRLSGRLLSILYAGDHVQPLKPVS